MRAMLQLKVCGMRDTDNIAELINVHPDYIGFIFHKASPRNVDVLPNIDFPDTIKKVGVFVDKNLSYIIHKAVEFKLNLIQLHGQETPGFCLKLKNRGYKIIKAFNIDNHFNFNELEKYKQHCDYFLFDSSGEKAGGNGILFNWKLLNDYRGNTPFFLSGGINKSMILEINKITHPMFKGIDINSCFEHRPAYKNIKMIREFKLQLSKKQHEL